MDKSTIIKLNQLNTEFYKKIEQYFHESRLHPWPGWEKLAEKLKKLNHKKKLSVLDLASGNGRFKNFIFLQFKKKEIDYFEIDNDEFLLDQSSHRYNKSDQLNLDIIESLVNDNLSQSIKERFVQEKFNIIVCFGFLHHIPSFELRKKFLNELVELLDDKSILIVTAWQFKNDEREMKKIVEPQHVKISEKQLEENDYILSWHRGVTAYRYCHFVDEEELSKLKPNNCKLKTFYADGKSGKLNLYAVLEKK